VIQFNNDGDDKVKKRTYRTKRPKADSRGNTRSYIGNAKFDFGKANQLSDQEFERRAIAVKEIFDKQCTQYEVDYWLDWVLPFVKKMAAGDQPVFDVSSYASANAGQAVEEATLIGHLRQIGIPIEPNDPQTIFVGETRLKQIVDEQIRRIVDESLKTVQQRHDLPVELRDRLSLQGPIDPATSELRSFHEALTAYRRYIDKTGKRNEKRQLADSPQNYKDWSKRLQEHHDDFPIWEMTKERLEEMFAYWRNRPVSKHTEGRMSYIYTKHILDCFWAVCTWLDEASDWKWEKPRGVNRISRVPNKLESDRKKKQVRRVSSSIYTPDELAIIANNLDNYGKLFLGLSVNCGMQPAESGRVEVLDFFESHPETKALGGWIIFDRPKTGEYGEWILWPEVAELVRWGVQRAKRLNVERLLVSDKLVPWYKDGTRNPTTQIGKWWQAIPSKSDPHEGIVTRLSRKLDGFPRHTLVYLRKILPSHIRPKFGKELADLANARSIGEGGTVRGSITDRYADRRYEQLAEAIRELQTDFRPFLEALKMDAEPPVRGRNQTQSDTKSDTESDI